MPQTRAEILRIKGAVRQRDGMRCVSCGMPDADHKNWCGRSLDVHRKEPGTPYTVDGCETVCKSCHMQLPKRAAGTLDAAHPGLLNVELAEDIRDAMEKFRSARGESIRDVVEQALLRHMANPPVRPRDQPLPPFPPEEPKKGRKP